MLQDYKSDKFSRFYTAWEDSFIPFKQFIVFVVIL